MTNNLTETLTLQKMLLEEHLEVSPTKLFYNSKNKYYYAVVSGVLKAVHRHIAEALLPNTKSYSDVNHKDSNRANNAPSNLEWCDRSYNIKHSYVAGRQAAFKDKVGKDHHLSKAVLGTHRDTKETIFLESLNQGKAVGFSAPGICRALKGERAHYKNYNWEYVSA